MQGQQNYREKSRWEGAVKSANAFFLNDQAEAIDYTRVLYSSRARYSHALSREACLDRVLRK